MKKLIKKNDKKKVNIVKAYKKCSCFCSCTVPSSGPTSKLSDYVNS